MGRLRDLHNKQKKKGQQGPPSSGQPLEEQISDSRASPGPASAPGDAILQDEESERREFEASGRTILQGTVERIQLGDTYTSDTIREKSEWSREGPAEGEAHQHVPVQVWGIGRRPAGVRGPLKLVGEESDQDYETIASALSRLHERFVPDGGIYSDKDGAVGRFADAVFSGLEGDSINRMVDRLVDARPFISLEMEMALPRLHKSGYRFIFDGTSVLTPDALPTAGEMLTQDCRLESDKTTGAALRRLVHPLEPYILAVSALRKRGVEAYNAYAVAPDHGGSEMYLPIIAVADPEGKVPLRTFDIYATHPPAGAIELISDTAAIGAGYAMLAECRTRRLVSQMFRHEHMEADFPPELVNAHISRISRALFMSIENWSGNPYVSRALTYVRSETGDAILGIDGLRHSRLNGGEVSGQIVMLAERFLRSGADPDSLPEGTSLERAAKEVVLDVVNASGEFAGKVQLLIGQMISRAAGEQPAGES
jgi:hypothetical protein